MRRRVLVGGAAIAFASVTLAACGGGDDGGSETAETGPVAELFPDTGAPADTGTTEEPAADEPAFDLPDDVLLSVDSTGEEVLALEQALAQLGYDPGPVDRTFNKKTRTAVVAFQRDRELDADGIVGPTTAAAINEALQALPSEG